MDVAKVVVEWKNKKAAPSLLGSKMVNLNPREKPFATLISKAKALQWWYVSILMGSLPN